MLDPSLRERPLAVKPAEADPTDCSAWSAGAVDSAALPQLVLASFGGDAITVVTDAWAEMS